MPAPQKASLPAFFELTNNYTIRVTALDPTSGALVAGVVVSQASVAVDPGDGGTPNKNVAVFPAFLPG